MQNFDNINQTRLTSEIAVYDSGVGGISFLPTVRRLLPAERFVYYGDLANAPYGDRSQDFIIERAREIVAFFRKRGVKALVIACNTATSAAAATLRAENPDLPIFGMEPAIHLAVKRGEKRIIMLATELTAHGEKLRRLLTAEAGAAEIVTIACPGLMELIETNLIKGETAAIKEYLQAKLWFWVARIIFFCVVCCRSFFLVCVFTMEIWEPRRICGGVWLRLVCCVWMRANPPLRNYLALACRRKNLPLICNWLAR